MKKLIILGAGASWDFGFPSGSELLKRVHDAWRSPNEFYVDSYLAIMEKFKQRFKWDVRENAQKNIEKLAHRLFYSGAESMDDFLSKVACDYDVVFGKMTIVRLIWESERLAAEDSGKSLFKWENNWLRIFFGQEFRRDNVDALINKMEGDEIKFITFNYDRSLEHFLLTALQNYYALPLDGKDIKSILNKISIKHIYGELAPLNWQVVNRDEALPFGEKFNGDFKDFEKLYKCSSNIKVINEDRGQESANDIRSECKRLVGGAERIYILGFGFHRANWDLLGIDDGWREEVIDKRRIPSNKFFYTTCGLSKGRESEIAAKFIDFIGQRAKPFNLSIYDYMLHHYV